MNGQRNGKKVNDIQYNFVPDFPVLLLFRLYNRTENKDIYQGDNKGYQPIVGRN